MRGLAMHSSNLSVVAVQLIAVVEILLSGLVAYATRSPSIGLMMAFIVSLFFWLLYDGVRTEAINTRMSLGVLDVLKDNRPEGSK